MRIRMVYRVPVESVAVPVDAKIGMRVRYRGARKKERRGAPVMRVWE